MVLGVLTFTDFQTFKVHMLLQHATPFVGIALFGGKFITTIQEVTCNKEKLGHVRCLAASGSKNSQGALHGTFLWQTITDKIIKVHYRLLFHNLPLLVRQPRK